MENVVDRARALRRKIEEAAATLSDEDALLYPELYPEWQGDGVVYKAGERVRRNGVLYTILQSNTSQEDWTPEAAASLFAKILVWENGEILEWEQPIGTNGYKLGDKVRYDGKVYESLLPINVWSPDAYPTGWKQIG